MNKKPELLLPAGSLEIAKLAIDHGADACYVGLKDYSARAKAQNLSLKEMFEAIDYAHERGAKIFCALNIVLFNEELEACIKACAELVAHGLDAFIVQDFGMATLLLTHFPEVEVHASTQMAIMNTSGAKAMELLGFDRVVLARETSLEVMQDIKKHTDIDIEVFVQGALCVSYSGLCYMSSFQGDRSGNRGQCAQPCRKKYTLVEKTAKGKKEIATNYLLSPKDMNLLGDLPELMRCGVESLKVEGRMKQPEYVALMAEKYRRHIDAIAEGETVSPKMLQADKKAMAQMFNRDGFSSSYLHGVPGKSMMSYLTPKNTGIPLGTLVKINASDCTVKLDEDLCLGDGVALYDKNLTPLWGGYLDKLADKNGEKGKAFKKGDTVIFKHDLKPSGDVTKVKYVYKTFDKELSKNLLKVRKAPMKKQEVLGTIHTFVRAEKGKTFSVMALYNGFADDVEALSYEYTTDFMIEAAKNGKSSRGVIEEGLAKLGGGRYEVVSIEITGEEAVFVPMSLVTKAKNAILEYFDATIQDETVQKGASRQEASAYTEAALEALDEIPPQISIPHKPLVTVQVRTMEQARAAIEGGCDELNVLLMDTYKKDGLSDDEIIVLSQETNLIVSLPILIKDMREEIYYKERCQNLFARGIKNFMIANLGQAVLLEDLGVEYFAGDYTLNLTNDLTSAALSQIGIGRQTISLEMDYGHINALSTIGNVPLEMVVHGKLSAMNTRCCPMGCLVGEREIDKPCSRPCVKRDFALMQDEKMYDVRSDQFCNVYLLNAQTYSLRGYTKDLASVALDYWRIAGVFMEPDDIKDTTQALCALRDDAFSGRKQSMAPMKSNTTDGHFIKGVR